MGQECADLFLELKPGSEMQAALLLEGAGAELRPARGDARVDFWLRDACRYWIDVRLVRAERPRLHVRIALTNDEWTVRAPLEAALGPLAPCLAGPALRDEHGALVATLDRAGWSRDVERHYGALRAQFVARVGDFNAPVSADHVYLYIHQARRRRDDERYLEERRAAEIARIEAMWDPPSPPDGDG